MEVSGSRVRAVPGRRVPWKIIGERVVGSWGVQAGGGGAPSIWGTRWMATGGS